MERKAAFTVAGALRLESQLPHSDSAKLDTQLLLSHVMKKDRAWFISHDDAELTAPQWQTLSALMLRRSLGEPIAYIIGSQSFWLDDFKVTKDTLIPRPDTELIVETVLDLVANTLAFQAFVDIVDLGTGSGAIAISLAKALPHANVTATDQSPEALAIAAENNQTIGTQVTFLKANWLQPFADNQFDIIISNPPYIEADDEHLDRLKYEPISALVADDDGYSDLTCIINTAANKLRPGGYIILEHGFEQQAGVVALLEQTKYLNITPLSDHGGNPRAVMATRPTQ